MKKHYLYQLLFSVFTLLICNLVFAIPSTGNARKISLKDAIDLAFIQNLDFAQTAKNFEVTKIGYDTAWRSFFLPSVSLSSTASSSYTLGAIPDTPANVDWKDHRNHGYPTSSIALNIASYTLFNFWRDRIAFNSAKLSFERAEQSYQEAKRNLKFQVINAYFQSKLNQETLEAAERSSLIAKTVLRLVKSRVSINLASQNEIDSATVDMNDAKIQVDQASTQYTSGLYSLNLLLNLPSTTLLDLTTPLEHKPSTLTETQILTQYRQTSPAIRSAKLGLQLAQNSLEIAEKNRLPLPTISFSGLSISYGNTYGGGTNAYSSTGSSAPGGQIELMAAINLTLPLYGPGGFLGSETIRSARIQAEVADIQLQSVNISSESQVKTAFGQLKLIHEQLITNKQSYESSAQLLDRIVSQLSTKPANRLELRDALARARDTELLFLRSTFDYISTKNTLYGLIGMDPEESQ